MSKTFDLFGDPIPDNWGERGRPSHVPTQQNRNRVSMLVALGWTNARIAAALFVTQPTLRKHYFSELRFRDVARDRLEAGVAMKLWEGVQAGSVSAIREFRNFIERNDMMRYGHAAHRNDKQPVAKEEKIGKKAEAAIAARTPNTSTPMGELMMRRQGELN